MTVSVCMCTYNGEQYIEPQLESVFAQTLTPDEVIICDDGSTDRTVEQIKTFIQQKHLETSWKLYCNEEKKGYPANFYYAMGLCGGEIVFLSDQDDVWHREKLERMTAIFETRPRCAAACCKFNLIDSGGRGLHSVMAPTHSGESGNLRRVGIEDVFYKCEWPGMVLAYRNAWYQEKVRELSAEPGRKVGDLCIPHDFLICAWAAEETGFLQADEVLAYHRRHEGNAGGEEHRFGRLLNKERKLGEIRGYLEYLESFESGDVLRTKEGRAALLKKKTSMEGRYEALKSGKIREVLRNAWRNREGMRLATIICDVVIAGQKDKKCHGVY